MAKLVSEVHWSYWIEIPKQALHTVCLCVTERLHCSVSSLILYSVFYSCSWRQCWVVTFTCGFRAFYIAGTSECKDSSHFTLVETWCWENDTCLKIPLFMSLKRECGCFSFPPPPKMNFSVCFIFTGKLGLKTSTSLHFLVKCLTAQLFLPHL